MRTSLPANVVDLPDLRDQVGVFRNRNHAGEILAGMLEVYSDSDAMDMAIPAGGVAVGKVLAEKLSLPFDLALLARSRSPGTRRQATARWLLTGL